MTDEIIYGLMDVFKRTNNQYLSLTEITRLIKAQGFYQNAELGEAAADLLVHYLNPPIFHKIENYRRRENWGKQWRVAHWLPRKENNSQDGSVSLLQTGKEIQRTMSSSGAEIKNGTIPLHGQDFDRFFASMDKEQQRRLNIDIYYYADESITCNLIEDDHNNWLIKSVWLGEWYKENRIEPGDKIWLVIKSITPLAINIYTEWERNPDTYRRYRQLQDSKPLPSVDLPIRDIIWDFLEQTQKIAHRLDIAKAVLEKRAKISEFSVYGCLSANPHLFIRVGEGSWGLKEWGLEQVKMADHPMDDPLEVPSNVPITTVPLDYILAHIASENLVYRILENSSKPLTIAEITEIISKHLHVNKDVLARTTFFDPSDPRFNRQEDGTFTLRKKLEELHEGLRELAEQSRETKVSLEEEINLLRTKIEVSTVQHLKQLNQIEKERDTLQKIAKEWIGHHEEINSQREKRIQLMSEFLAEAVPHIGQDKLREIFEHLHHKSEARNIIDSNEIIKFSKIVHKFLPDLQD